MPVVPFRKPPQEEGPPPIMVDFSISGGRVSVAGRMPILEAIEKLEEAADLLRAELKADEQP